MRLIARLTQQDMPIIDHKEKLVKIPQYTRKLENYCFFSVFLTIKIVFLQGNDNSKHDFSMLNITKES